MARFPYILHSQSAVGMPLIDLQLLRGSRSVAVSALVDSGASLNILPLDIGSELGFVWADQTFAIDLGGVLAGV